MSAILCPIDLTPASETALHAAAAIAGKLKCAVTLLHVVDPKEARDAKILADKEAKLNKLAAEVVNIASATPMMRIGDFLKEITAASAIGHQLLVACTHGPRGLRQSIFGADILKLVRMVKIPSLVVQEDGRPLGSGKSLVLPVAGHEAIHTLLDSVSMIAREFGLEVHVFQLMRPGEQPSDQLLKNKLAMLQRMADDGIACKEVNEPSTTFSIGFAEQTAAYAAKVDAVCIAIMAVASDEYRYIADAEKERMLMNSPRIPVLCAG